MINGEAGGQIATGDRSQEAVGVAVRNRIDDSEFFASVNNYQDALNDVQQFNGLGIPAGMITNGPEPALSKAAKVFTREVSDFISPSGGTKSLCFFSPTLSQYQAIMNALVSGTKSFAGIPNPTGCFESQGNVNAGFGPQIRAVSSIAENSDPNKAPAPAFVFVGNRNRSTEPAVIQIQN